MTNLSTVHWGVANSNVTENADYLIALPPIHCSGIRTSRVFTEKRLIVRITNECLLNREAALDRVSNRAATGMQKMLCATSPHQLPQLTFVVNWRIVEYKGSRLLMCITSKGRGKDVLKV